MSRLFRPIRGIKRHGSGRAQQQVRDHTVESGPANILEIYHRKIP